MFRKKKAPPAPLRERAPTDRRPAKVFSYYTSSRQPSDSGVRDRAAVEGMRQRQSRRLDWLKDGQRAAGLALAAVIVLAVLYNVSLSTNPQVTVLGRPEERLLLKPTAVYQAAARKQLASSFGNRFKPTSNTAAFTKAMQKQFPELVSVRIELPLIGSKPVVTLEPSHSALVLVASDGKSYVVDYLGRAISVESDKAAANLPAVYDQTGLPVSVGAQMLPAEDVAFMQSVYYQSTQQHIQIESFTLPATAKQLVVHLKGKGYYVKYTFHNDPLQQEGTYAAIQHKLDTDHVTPAEYVDVRVPGRAYYK